MPSDLTEFVMVQGNGVKGLSEMGLKSVPREYIQPLEERVMKVVAGESIPIIDMSNWEDPEVEDAICDAAEKWGFFQIINHGVPLQVLENVKKATHRFYEMAPQEKVKFTKENSASKHVRYGSSFSPEAEKALEWKDYLSLFYVSEHEAQTTWPPACRYTVISQPTRVSPCTLLKTKDTKKKKKYFKVNINFFLIKILYWTV